MIEQLIKQRRVEVNGWLAIFKVFTTCKSVYIRGHFIRCDFDIENDNELKIITKILIDLIDNDRLKNEDDEIVDDKIQEKLDDLETLTKILNKYKN